MLHTLTKWCPILSLGDHAKQLENIPPVHTEFLYLRSRWKGRRAGSPGWCCAGWPGSRKCSRTATHPSDPGGREAAARRPAAPAQPRYGGPGDPGNGRDETLAPRRRQAGRWGRGEGVHPHRDRWQRPPLPSAKDSRVHSGAAANHCRCC